jgi:hypothetical protein
MAKHDPAVPELIRGKCLCGNFQFEIFWDQSVRFGFVTAIFAGPPLDQ